MVGSRSSREVNRGHEMLGHTTPTDRRRRQVGGERTDDPGNLRAFQIDLTGPRHSDLLRIAGNVVLNERLCSTLLVPLGPFLGQILRA